MFSFVGDTVLDPFCGSGTSLIAALKARRNSIGVDIEPEYCRMAARTLKAESQDLFNHAELKFEKMFRDKNQLHIREDQELYQIRSTKSKFEENT